MEPQVFLQAQRYVPLGLYNMFCVPARCMYVTCIRSHTTIDIHTFTINIGIEHCYYICIYVCKYIIWLHSHRFIIWLHSHRFIICTQYMICMYYNSPYFSSPYIVYHTLVFWNVVHTYNYLYSCFYEHTINDNSNYRLKPVKESTTELQIGLYSSIHSYMQLYMAT